MHIFLTLASFCLLQISGSWVTDHFKKRSETVHTIYFLSCTERITSAYYSTNHVVYKILSELPLMSLYYPGASSTFHLEAPNQF